MKINLASASLLVAFVAVAAACSGPHAPEDEPVSAAAAQPHEEAGPADAHDASVVTGSEAADAHAVELTRDAEGSAVDIRKVEETDPSNPHAQTVNRDGIDAADVQPAHPAPPAPAASQH